MTIELREFLTGLGACLLQRDADGIFKSFAPWLDDDDRGRFIEEMRSVRETNDPDSIELGENPTDLDALAEDGFSLPGEVTKENFLGWCCITVGTEEDQDYYYDFWCAVVREGEECKVGYFEVHGED